jgi:hypothetical protein
MRRWILVAMLAAMAVRAQAARRVTVEQLRQFLAEQRAANKQDGDIAARIAGLELSEQLTGTTLDRLVADSKAGSKTAQAVAVLADASTFLEPPSSELPATTPPDIAAQRVMFKGAFDFVAKTLTHLPNFLATRVTHSFSDAPIVVGHYGTAAYSDLHPVGTFSRDITYRDGREVVDATAANDRSQNGPEPVGLTSWGEFGPALGIILTDTLKGKVTWSHWEQMATGQAAVFRYSVPKEASHYVVNFCCLHVDTSLDVLSGSNSYHGTPGYHGALYLDPATGSVLRITAEAELQRSDPITRAAISVQYARMEIGGHNYLCPIRSVAISADQSRPGTNPTDTEVVRINEVSFTNYHRFGSTVRIVPAPAEP